MSRPKLYPDGPELPTFRYKDYNALVGVCRGAKTVLEFGPGISTYALIEAGAEKIVTLEHDDKWFQVAVDRFKDFPQVTVARYWDEVPVRADEVAHQHFDIAFVDSPKGFNHPIPGVKGTRKKHPGMEDCSRLNTCLFALERAPIVYLHDSHRPLEKGTLGRLWRAGHSFQQIPAKSGLARIERNANKNRPGSQGPEESRGAAAGAVA